MSITILDIHAGWQRTLPAARTTTTTKTRRRVESLPEGDDRRFADAWERLTVSQRAILRLRAEGKTTGDVARELSLSSQTVKNHLCDAYRALGFKGFCIARVVYLLGRYDALTADVQVPRVGSFGDELRTLLVEREVSTYALQFRLSGCGDWGGGTVSRLCTGKRDPSRVMVARIVEALELDEATSDRLFVAAGFVPSRLMGETA